MIPFYFPNGAVSSAPRASALQIPAGTRADLRSPSRKQWPSQPSQGQYGPRPARGQRVAIGDDLATHVFAGATDPVELLSSPERGASSAGQIMPTSMIMLRYSNAGAAKQVASRQQPPSRGPVPSRSSW